MNAISKPGTVYFITLMVAYTKDRGYLDTNTVKESLLGPLAQITLVNLRMAWCMVKVYSRKLMVAKSTGCGSMVNYPRRNILVSDRFFVLAIAFKWGVVQPEKSMNQNPKSRNNEYRKKYSQGVHQYVVGSFVAWKESLILSLSIIDALSLLPSFFGVT